MTVHIATRPGRTSSRSVQFLAKSRGFLPRCDVGQRSDCQDKRSRGIDTYCVHCAAPARDHHRFCGECGSALHIRCPRCRTLVEPGLRFCTSCGAEVGAPRAAVAHHEERRTVTILFVDLIGFTALAERLDPEDVRDLQATYFRTASRIIRTHGGVVEKYIGDAVMAIYGAPVSGEHDAFRAVRTGLELQRVLDGQAAATEGRLRARVGIATGEALVDLDAIRDRGQALVTGDVVNTASRLQALAPAGGVLVNGATRRATAGSVRYDEQLPVQPEGKASTVEVWLAREMLRDRLGLDAVDDWPVVGREHELELLTQTLVRCVRDRVPQLVSIVGSPGAGKSRLLRELFRRVDATPELVVRWRSGRCMPYGENGAFGPLAEVVKSHAGILDTDDARTARARLVAALDCLVDAEEVPRLTDTVAPLVGLPGVTVTPDEAEASWHRVILAFTRQLPAVLVVEDLQWADPALLRFLAGAVEAAEGLPLLVICTHRPELLERDPGWAGVRARTLTVNVGPLPTGDMQRLLTLLLDGAPPPPPLSERLVGLAGGNPLYAQEFVRMLREQGRLVRVGDTWTLDPQADLSTPETVQSLVASRLDLLSRDDRAVVQAAAVVGAHLWPGAVAALVDVPVAEAENSLRRLVAKDLLAERPGSRMGGHAEYVFRHAIIRQIAYSRLPRAVRAGHHHRVADWLDGLTGERPAVLVETLARHRTAALNLARTLRWDTTPYEEPARRTLVAAAHQAYRLHSLDAALQYVDQALALWPDSHEVPERRRAELLRSQVRFLRDCDGFYREGGVKELEDLAGVLRAEQDLPQAAAAYTQLGQVEWMRTEKDAARAHLRRALDLFADLPDSEAKAEAWAEWARLHMLDFRRDEAVLAAGTASGIARRLGLREVEANAMITAATARYLAGEPAGLPDLEEAVEYCRRHRLPSLRRAILNLSTVLQEEGDLRRSHQLERESRHVHGGRKSLISNFSESAERAYFDGDWEAMLAAAGEFLDGRDDETADWDLQLRGIRGWIRVLRGEDPCDTVMRCLTAARRSGFRRLLRGALAHGALCLVLQDRPEEAAGLLAELAQSWREDPSWPSREWVPAAAHAAALLGPESTAAMQEILRSIEHDTLWRRAATHLLDGAAATHRGEHALAARRYAQAVEVYDEMGDETDAALTAAWTLRALVAAGDRESARAWQERVRTFARRNGAGGLLAGLHALLRGDAEPGADRTIVLDPPEGGAATGPPQSSSRPASIA
jgi:class 3 adenylate cyclase/tetratricopeptide (TPR) repeat protein